MVDVYSTIEISRSPADLARFASDPDNAPTWYVNIKSVEWETEPPAVLGSRIAFVAHFLGKKMAYTYELAELEPGARMVMRTSEGPFPTETTYRFEENESGGTTMGLRNRGEPSGFAKITAPLMVGAMRRANRKDLELLKSILEAQA